MRPYFWWLKRRHLIFDSNANGAETSVAFLAGLKLTALLIIPKPRRASIARPMEIEMFETETTKNKSPRMIDRRVFFGLSAAGLAGLADAADKMIEDLFWWSSALKNARESTR